MKDTLERVASNMTDKDNEKLIPRIMIDYLSNLAKSNADWEIAMKEAIKEKFTFLYYQLLRKYALNLFIMSKR